MVAGARVDALIWLVDPLSPPPHDVDFKPLMRVALVHDLPMALSVATAELLVRSRRTDDQAEA